MNETMVKINRTEMAKRTGMDFNDYQKEARKTAIYPEVGRNMWYPALGLGGESGEVLEVIKKVYRDHAGWITVEASEKLKKELGDTLWYISNICSEVGFDFNDIAQTNLQKLASRQERNVIHGSGSDR